MAGMINSLIDLMNEQASRYEDLLGLSREKREVIIKNDVDALQKITNLENILVSQNQKLERRRLEVAKDIAAVMNKSEAEMTLGALIELMDGQTEQTQLIEAGNRIRGVLSELSEENRHNASLIDNALDYVEFSLNVIRSAVEQNPGFYNAPGAQAQNDAGVFDAKN